jgi:hypothetical protein
MAERSEDKGSSVPKVEHVQALFNLITGFRITSIIYVAAKLGIADLLKDGPRTPDDLAEATSTHGPSLYRMLRALAGFGVFAEDEQGRFGLTPLAELLQTGVQGSQRAAALFFGDQSSWRSWGELLYTVTTGETAFQHLHGMNPWEYQTQHPELNAIFEEFMVANTTRQTPAIVAAYDFSHITTLVDVGGGYGTLIAAILRANPRMRGILCDAPGVVAGALQLLEAAGVSDRCERVSCDFFESVPEGGDAYLLKSIIHDWDDERALAILNTCRRAMPENGTILLVENLIPPGNEYHLAKITDLQMMVELGGRERTDAEYSALLTEAGFRLTRVVPTQSTFAVIEGVPV